MLHQHITSSPLTPYSHDRWFGAKHTSSYALIPAVHRPASASRRRRLRRRDVTPERPNDHDVLVPKVGQSTMCTIAPSAACLLAAPKTPDSVRQDAISPKPPFGLTMAHPVLTLSADMPGPRSA